MPGHKQTEVGAIPQDWKIVRAAQACSKIQDGTHFSPRSGGSDYLYVTSKNVRFGKLDLSTAGWIDATQHRAIYRRCDVRQGDLLLTKDGASTGNAALNTLAEEFSLLSSVAFLRFDPGKHCAAYFLQQILSSQGQRQIQDAVAGNAITRLTLEKINQLRFPVPPTRVEEEAIAEALTAADAVTDSLEQLHAKKRQLKQGVMQELLTCKRRLPGFSGEWATVRLQDLLSYERPDKYIVQDTEYSEHGAVPVLTANKSFVLGYTDESSGICSDLPAIVFDDFTTASKYADFPFKVKSSAIKLLRPKHDRVSLRFVFERMQLIRFPIGAHKRYYISEFQNLEVATPDFAEQQAIATALSDIDAELSALEAKLAKAHEIKQGMTQELLTGRTRLV